MGAWGGGLFQSDQDLDVASDISGDAKMNLQPYPDDSEDGDSKTVEEKVKALNENLFTNLFNKYKNESSEYNFFGAKYYSIILVALAMQLGAEINAQQLAYINSIYRRAGLMKEGIDQMKEALEKYKPGTPWAFDSPGLLETMARSMEEPPAAEPSGLRGGNVLLNHFAPRYFEDGVSTPDIAQVMIDKIQNSPNCDYCGKNQFWLSKQKLKRCARCRDTFYCDRDCQKKHWYTHKRRCSTE